MPDDRPLVPEELLSAAVDGELSPFEERRLAAALAENPALQAEIDSLRALKARLRAQIQPAAPAPLQARLGALLDQIDAEPLAQPGRGARPHRRAPGVRSRRLVLAVAAAAVLALLPLSRWFQQPAQPTATDTAQVAYHFEPALLARNHRRWHEASRRNPHPLDTPDHMAKELARQVGYTVRPPDLDALDAELVGCGACWSSFESSEPAALFLMRHGGKDLTLFEVEGGSDKVCTTALKPVDGGPVMVAQAADVAVAVAPVGSLYACLVGTELPVDELARLVPHAVRVALGLPDTRLVRRPSSGYGLTRIALLP